MARRKKRTDKYKSNFEASFAKQFPHLEYESSKIKYNVEHTYTPDWKISETKFIETKGLWKAVDRAKHLHIREQHPEITIYLVFQNPNNKLNRASNTTYAEWCNKHGVPWATIDTIPMEWFQ